MCLCVCVCVCLSCSAVFASCPNFQQKLTAKHSGSSQWFLQIKMKTEMNKTTSVRSVWIHEPTCLWSRQTESLIVSHQLIMRTRCCRNQNLNQEYHSRFIFRTCFRWKFHSNELHCRFQETGSTNCTPSNRWRFAVDQEPAPPPSQINLRKPEAEPLSWRCSKSKSLFYHRPAERDRDNDDDGDDDECDTEGWRP